LARTCVFAKQSLGPIHCGSAEPPARSRSPRPASLLPKLRDQYAEFLDHVSLAHLRLLASPTCVGLRYGRRDASPGSFSRVSTPGDSLWGRPRRSPSRLGRVAPAYAVRRPIHTAAPPSFHGPSRAQRRPAGPESSPAVHRLRLWGLALGSASPCADRHGAGNLGLPVRGVLTHVCAYSIRHPHFRSLHGLVPTPASSHAERSPTPDRDRSRPSFGGPLNPDHSRRDRAGPVSYYALFKGVAASKPTSRLSRHDHILRYTQRPLRGLSCGSGFFPSRRRTLSPGDCLPGSIRQVFGVWLGLVGTTSPRAHPVALPPADTAARRPPPRPYLNRFRGEPAISRLDWPFTPTHKSSERFSTHTGSGLH
jgi:hypothetical protein